MVNYLNDTQDLEEELRDTGTEYNDLDFDRKLRQAHNRMERLVGKRFVEPVVIQFEDETDVELEFGLLHSFDKVVNYSEGNEIVDASNYTEDLTTGTVSFNQAFVDDNFFEGLILKFYYTPQIFADLELYLAQRNIQELQTIQTRDGVNNTQVDRLNQRINALVKNINSANSVSLMNGDNQNRGSQSPRYTNDTP